MMSVWQWQEDLAADLATTPPIAFEFLAGAGRRDDWASKLCGVEDAYHYDHVLGGVAYEVASRLLYMRSRRWPEPVLRARVPSVYGKTR